VCVRVCMCARMRVRACVSVCLYVCVCVPVRACSTCTAVLEAAAADVTSLAIATISLPAADEDASGPAAAGDDGGREVEVLAVGTRGAVAVWATRSVPVYIMYTCGIYTTYIYTLLRIYTPYICMVYILYVSL
jgi:hypothetical protein